MVSGASCFGQPVDNLWSGRCKVVGLLVLNLWVCRTPDPGTDNRDPSTALNGP